MSVQTDKENPTLEPVIPPVVNTGHVTQQVEQAVGEPQTPSLNLHQLGLCLISIHLDTAV